jgi:hypothetical protein
MKINSQGEKDEMEAGWKTPLMHPGYHAQDERVEIGKMM